MQELEILNETVPQDLLTEMEMLQICGGTSPDGDTYNGCNIYCPCTPDGGGTCGGDTCGGDTCGGDTCGGGTCGGDTCGGGTCGGNTCGGNTCGSNNSGNGSGNTGNSVYMFANCKGH